jgi:hypothetical protein
MAKVEGLNLREGRWHVRIVIPDDLKATYKKAREVKCPSSPSRPLSMTTPHI